MLSSRSRPPDLETATRDQVAPWSRSSVAWVDLMRRAQHLPAPTSTDDVGGPLHCSARCGWHSAESRNLRSRSDLVAASCLSSNHRISQSDTRRQPSYHAHLSDLEMCSHQILISIPSHTTATPEAIPSDRQIIYKKGRGPSPKVWLAIAEYRAEWMIKSLALTVDVGTCFNINGKAKYFSTCPYILVQSLASIQFTFGKRVSGTTTLLIATCTRPPPK